MRPSYDESAVPLPGQGPIKCVFGCEGEIFAVRELHQKDGLFLLLNDGGWLEIKRQ